MLRLIIFSLFLHGSLAGTLWFFSGASDGQATEEVWHAAIVQYPAPAGDPNLPPAPPPPAAEAEVTPPPPPPVEPPPAPPKPEPVPPKPAEKAVSPKKKPAQTPKREAAEPAAPPPPAAAPPASSAGGGGVPGGAPHQIGGLGAYDMKTVQERPVVTKAVTPEYPPDARRRNLEGQVVVRLVVDAEGKPQHCAVHSAKPAGVFEESALAAARRTRFIPGKVSGRAVNTLILMPYKFALR